VDSLHEGHLVNSERLLSWTFLKENLDKHSAQGFLTKSCEEPAIVESRGPR
jgi:hypothetical protein